MEHVDLDERGECEEIEAPRRGPRPTRRGVGTVLRSRVMRWREEARVQPLAGKAVVEAAFREDQALAAAQRIERLFCGAQPLTYERSVAGFRRCLGEIGPGARRCAPFQGAALEDLDAGRAGLQS